jgi:hypothetical protein
MNIVLETKKVLKTIVRQSLQWPLDNKKNQTTNRTEIKQRSRILTNPFIFQIFKAYQSVYMSNSQLFTRNFSNEMLKFYVTNKQSPGIIEEWGYS